MFLLFIVWEVACISWQLFFTVISSHEYSNAYLNLNELNKMIFVVIIFSVK